MTENQLFQAARNMRSMGSFAAAIGDAFFAADTNNRETLIEAFKGLFERANQITNGLTPEQQKTRNFMLLVVQADGPCTLKHVLSDCKTQGFTSGIVQALQSLKDEQLVTTEEEDGETIIELTNKGNAA
jgi:hypothetical protein